MTQPAPAAILVAGPTASGKSALALGLARRLGGTVINADSMQVYRDLRVLTARPTPAEEALVPHVLYGIRPAAAAASVAWWREEALAAMAAARAAGRLPILCGGTGLYFAALTQGLSAIPPVPAAARAEARALLAEIGAPALHARLAAADPETAATLRPADSQRVARAWEVWRGTGRGLLAWQREAGRTGPAPARFAAVLLDPPRDALRTAIARRFDAMLAAGALEEVRALAAQGLDPALPAMRAHGVPELLAHLQGTMTLAAARERAVLNTGQYTKRQATWFRHHALAAPTHTHIIHARMEGVAQFQECIDPKILAFVDQGR
ncbi:tRNA (adenosine(37)-N6)-dimethylallyltransferase MiaA [Paracraurococcus ruber]|uniref:tRNA dimethylallyltransferase n=1 Tax=Paracraurococcus ruber TaxID=77675 RepID=A0ABS1CZB2_9PROT|nr:tRNA (adenosine(37)-N6)-dimethylallyltransferase MiaA [Paracraurococcus ruber]MBK1659847.1 tRNA (adenosine(37)-N6)-dimethylallyltransferase MiaA [Paracraurococcus ruber]TDG32134.1 tRNA (adenosine(37)-N6)-dimethylallyltransferase MiaA [Paracraurococcus ruber]